MNKLQSARVENYDLYMSVRDKWFEQIDNTYKKIFTPEQWVLYLKTGAAKNIKAREKRKEKMQKSSATAQPAKKEKPMSF